MLRFVKSHRRLTVLILALPAAVVCVAHPTLASALSLDVWNVPKLHAEIRALTARYDQLENENHEVSRRIEIKEAFITELIAGRMTLAEVTAQFLAMDSSRTVQMNVIRNAFPGANDEEKMARNVIQYTLYRIPASQQAEVASRLDRELQQMLSHDADMHE